jgi:MFS family permease
MKDTNETVSAAPAGRARSALRGSTFVQVMAHRNYLYYSIGDGVSLIGNWTQRVAISWLAWEMTHSGLWLGIVAFADLFPAVIFSPIGGVIADRGDPKRISMSTQCLAMVQSLALFLFTWTGTMDMALLVTLSVIRGALAAVNQPARMSVVPSLIPRGDLPAALAINSVLFNLARFIGPAIAGAVIVAGGVAAAFAINAATYFVLIWALWMIDIPPQTREHKGPRGFFSQITAGYSYVSAHPGIGPLLLIFAAATVLVRPITELLPGFADGIFGRGAQGLAWMTSAVGLGAMLGGASMIRRADTARLVKAAVGSLMVLSACILAFALIPSFWLGLVLLFVFGMTTSASGIGTQTLTQSAVDDAMRGRVMSLYGVIFRGGPAVGALIMGAVSEHLGLQIPVAIGAAICLGVAAWAATKRESLATHLRKPSDEKP